MSDFERLMRRWRWELRASVEHMTGKLVCAWHGQHWFVGGYERHNSDGTCDGYDCCTRCGHKSHYAGRSRVATQRVD